MRHLSIIVLIAGLGPATPAAAAEIASGSKISFVTVFPTGAEVTRQAKVKVPAGDHTLIFDHLPALAMPGSIRIEGRSTGRLEIGSVDTRRVLVPHADPEAQATERRRIETEIEKLRDEAAVIEADIKAADAQKALINKLTELPQHPPAPGPQGSAPTPDWGQLFGLVGSKLAEAERAQLAAKVKLRDVERRIKDLEKKLASLAPGQQQRTEAKVFVTAAAPLEADITIRYQVGNAWWRPYYDARLSTGNKSTKPKLTLIRRASIQQRSGEDWIDVGMELSTTRPGTGTSAPELYPQVVDFEPDIPPPRPVPMPRAGASRSLKANRMRDAESAPTAAAAPPPAPAMVAARERQAEVEAAAFQALFKVPGKVSVQATGEQKRVQLSTEEMGPSLIVRTTPRLQETAYLYTKVTTPSGAPYLAGQVALFRDGTFVGNGRLPQLTPGEMHELGFGADDAVRVRHALVEEKRGETGIISTSKTDTRKWRIIVKNAHAQAIQLSIIDQIPVSQNQEIKVETIAKPLPTRRDIEERRGVHAWDSTLGPNQDTNIEIGYSVTWPSGKHIQYRRQ